MPPRPPDPRAHPMAVGHGPQQDGSWPMEDRIAGASLGSLPGVKPSADRGCRETDATLLNRDSPFLVAATTMWEIETNGVGNGVAGSPVATGWTGSVDTPPWGDSWASPSARCKPGLCCRWASIDQLQVSAGCDGGEQIPVGLPRHHPHPAQVVLDLDPNFPALESPR